MSKHLKRIFSILCIFSFVFLFVSSKSVSALEQIISRQDESYINQVTPVNYQRNEVVEVFVEVKGDSLIDMYDENKYESVSDYISSNEGKKQIEIINGNQTKVKKQIEELNISVDYSNSYQYQVITNGFSLQTKVSNIDDLYKLAMVNDVWISNTYEAISYIDDEYQTYAYKDHYYTDNLMNSSEVNDAGYTGKGITVAVIDTGMDLNHIGFSGDVVNPKYTKESLDEFIKSLSLTAKGVLGADGVYFNEKIPYAFDYANNDTDVYNIGNPHGAHVAGIVGANTGLVQGVAVDTQIFAMKVFSDEGAAYDTYILAAVEDCLKLGVDVANMSLGSACGSSYVTGKTAEVYDQVRDKGINLIVAAGNDGSVGSNNLSETDLPFASSPDYGLVASPSTYTPSLSVASVDNPTYMAMYVKVTDQVLVPYSETTTYIPLQINNALDGQTLDFVILSGVGRNEEFEEIDVEGKVVLVSRGEISFTEKMNNIHDHGGVAMIVYNPDDDMLIGMEIDDIKIPSIFIRNCDYNSIVNSGSHIMSFSKDNYGDIPNIYSGMVSSFSSWGTTRDLEIKPEVAGPGAYIYSTVYDDKYDQFSGTSMASPNVAGVAALLCEYIAEKYPSKTKIEKVDLVNTLLMETAKPSVDEDGNNASVRAQGAGVVDAKAAVNTNAVIKVENSLRPKAELGSSQIGEFEYQFTIENSKNENITYILETCPQTDSYIEIDGINYSTKKMRPLETEEYIISYSNNVVDGKITVASNSSVTIDVVIKITSQFKNTQDPIFTNGSYVEGYTFLNTDTDENLVIPFLGFYGDFDNLPILEGNSYENDKSSFNMLGTMAAIFSAAGTGEELGMDPVNEVFYKDKIYFSCSNMKGNSITSYNGLFRNIDYIKYKITDENGEIIYEKTAERDKKSFYYSNGDYVYAVADYEGWKGIKLDETMATNGEKFSFTTTVGIYRDDHETVLKEETWSFDFTIDSTAPKMVNYKIVEEEGIKYLDVTVSDNFEVGFVTIYDMKINHSVTETQVYSGGETQTVIRFEMDEILEGLAEYEDNNSQIQVEITDWAHNFVYIPITIGPSSIRVDEEYKVAITGQKQLEVTTTPANIKVSDLKFTSSDDRIATVDEKGVVTGVSAGNATITITGNNGIVKETNVVVGGSVDQEIQITNSNVKLEIAKTVNLKVAFKPLDVIDTSIKWTSSDESIAKVSKNGIVEGIKMGTAIITATSAGGNTSQIEVTVIAQAVETVYLYASYSTIQVGTKGVIDMITIVPKVENNANVIFTSSDESVIIIHQDGSFEGVGLGKAIITLASLDGSQSSSLTYYVVDVKSTDIDCQNTTTIKCNEQIQLNYQIIPSNTTNKDVEFVIGNDEIATIDETGLITPKNVGTTSLTIKNGKIEKVVFITVIPVEIESVSGTEHFVEIEENSSKELSIDIKPIDATFKNLLWTSSNSEIVKVYNGIITGMKKGNAVVTVKTMNGISYEFYVIVNEKAKEIYHPEVNIEDVSLEVNKTMEMNVSIRDANLIQYRIENDNVAVIYNSIIYTRCPGTTKVDIIYNNEVIDSFNIEVKELENGCQNVNTIIFNFISLGSIIFIVMRRKNK